MGLWFQNAYTDPVYIAILWYNPGCGAEPWQKSGWYEVAPGSSIEIVGANLQSIPDSNFAWFAQADWADGPCWSGDPAHNWYAIPHNAAFDQCYSDNTGCNAAYPFNAATLSQAPPERAFRDVLSASRGSRRRTCSISPCRRSWNPIGVGRLSQPASPIITTAPARSLSARWSTRSLGGPIVVITPAPRTATSSATSTRR